MNTAFLILVALLGADSFKVREAAHKAVAGNLHRGEVRAIVELHADGLDEAGLRCRAIIDDHDRRLFLAGKLYPRGWRNLPRIAFLPDGNPQRIFIRWYCNQAREMVAGEDAVEREATKMVLAWLWSAFNNDPFYTLGDIRMILEEMATRELATEAVTTLFMRK